MRLWRAVGRRLFIFAAVALASLGVDGHGEARQWKPSAVSAAREYLKIQHQISDRESILLIWMAPQYFPETRETEAMRSMMKDFVVLAFVHVSISKLGEWSFKAASDLTIEVGDSAPMQPLPRESLAPVVMGTVDTMKTILAQGLGRLGEGMQILVFEGSKVDSCKEGVIWVPYQSERYDFRTPLAGCP